MNSNYNQYQTILKKIADVNYSSAVLQWDQEIYMPEKGAKYRGQQLSTLAGISHELSTSDELGTLLEKLSEDKTLTEKQSRNVAESFKSYKDQKKYNIEFVITLSKTVSEAYQAWHSARTEDKFEIFAPLLEKLVELKRKECEILGYEKHPYNALMNQYEPGAKVEDLDVLFEDVKNRLVPFVKRIASVPQKDSKFLYKHYDKTKQWDFGIDLLRQMHYDFNSGRQDISAHPFTTNFNALDVRVTTRINENDIREMIWGCIHEGGHALYEQGLNPDDYGLPTGEAISLGIHESQSRLWENNVGRSLPYWKANYARLQAVFPENLGDVSLDAFYKGINVVEPSLIRTSADELTYHSHIMIRYGIEKALIAGELSVNDLPKVWNKSYKDYLGVDVPSDAQGVLQDIHWSHGSFGYFATYSLGSFYAAQFFNKVSQDMPDLQEKIESGRLKPLREWLRENIHQYGKFYKAEELCKKVCGEKLSFEYFMNYAEKKFSGIYELDNVGV